LLEELLGDLLNGELISLFSKASSLPPPLVVFDIVRRVLFGVLLALIGHRSRFVGCAGCSGTEPIADTCRNVCYTFRWYRHRAGQVRLRRKRQTRHVSKKT
jgi:hypothetical protein